MAGDWIKMRTCLRREPEVIAIAQRLGVSTRHVVGLLLDLWGLADQHAVSRFCPDDTGTKEGHLSRYCPAIIDEEVGQAGFAAAIEEVGWLVVYPDGVAIPNWDVHNGTSAKARASEQKKKSRQREMSRCERDICPGVVGTKGGTREEKRREDIDPPSEDLKGSKRPKRVSIPESLDTDAFRAVWADWLSYRRERRLTTTPRTLAAQLARCASWGPTVAVDAIRASIANGWAGVFPPKPEGHAEAPAGMSAKEARSAEAVRRFAERMKEAGDES